MTNLDIITRALRLIGVLAEASTPKAEQASDALVALDGLLAGWEREGVTPTPRPLTLAQTPAPANAHLDAIVYGLAVRLAPEYGLEPTATVVRLAQEREARLLAGGRTAAQITGTAVTYITRAMRLLGLLRDGDQPRIEQVQNALQTMEGLLAEWEAWGYPETPRPLTADTTIFTTSVDLDALVYNLALQMSPEFGVAPAPVVVERADRRLRQLMAAYVCRRNARPDAMYRQPRTGWPFFGGPCLDQNGLLTVSGATVLVDGEAIALEDDCP